MRVAGWHFGWDSRPCRRDARVVLSKLDLHLPWPLQGQARLTVSHENGIPRTHSSKLKASAPERDGRPWKDNTELRRIETSLGLRLSDEWISATAEAKRIGVSVGKARTRHPCSASANELLREVVGMCL